jgi:uncharacterized coiled-coil DUF342 family protein
MPSHDASLQREEQSALQVQIPQKRVKRIWNLIRDLAHEVRNTVHEIRDLIRNAVHEIRDLAHEVRNAVHEIRDLAHEIRNAVHEIRDLIRNLVRLLESQRDERDWQPAFWSNDGISRADFRDRGYRNEEDLDF